MRVKPGSRYVALIRGINVGRAKRVSMADLRAALEDLGCTNVRTLLNSGNAAFTATAAVARRAAVGIEGALASRTGVRARAFVLDEAGMDAIVSENTLTGIAENPSRLMVSVLFNPADRSRLSQVARADWAPEAVAVGSRAVYAWCPRSISDSPLLQAVGRVLGEQLTTRNWTTIQKLYLLQQGS